MNTNIDTIRDTAAGDGIVSDTRSELPRLDVGRFARPSLARITGVELRKLVDTRAGLWLLASIGLLTVGVVGLTAVAASEDNHTFSSFLTYALIPQAYLVPVLAILLITSEWGQRTALATFTLEPSRSRVIAAKIIAAILVASAGVVLAAVFAAGGTAAIGVEGAWTDEAGGVTAVLGGSALTQLTATLAAVALGLLLLNSAAAIVLNFVVPIVFGLFTNWSAVTDLVPWVSVANARVPLTNYQAVTGEVWGQIAVSSLIAIVVPIGLGLRRVLTMEIK